MPPVHGSVVHRRGPTARSVGIGNINGRLSDTKCCAIGTRHSTGMSGGSWCIDASAGFSWSSSTEFVCARAAWSERRWHTCSGCGGGTGSDASHPSRERLRGSRASRWLSAVVPERDMPTMKIGASMRSVVEFRVVGPPLLHQQPGLQHRPRSARRRPPRPTRSGAPRRRARRRTRRARRGTSDRRSSSRPVSATSSSMTRSTSTIGLIPAALPPRCSGRGRARRRPRRRRTSDGRGR